MTTKSTTQELNVVVEESGLKRRPVWIALAAIGFLAAIVITAVSFSSPANTNTNNPIVPSDRVQVEIVPEMTMELYGQHYDRRELYLNQSASDFSPEMTMELYGRHSERREAFLNLGDSEISPEMMAELIKRHEQWEAYLSQGSSN
jgi:hypothetical protein